jgi:hypothetical protein
MVSVALEVASTETIAPPKLSDVTRRHNSLALPKSARRQDAGTPSFWLPHARCDRIHPDIARRVLYRERFGRGRPPRRRQSGADEGLIASNISIVRIGDSP